MKLLSLPSGRYELRPLCAAGLLEYIRLTRDCLRTIAPPDGSDALSRAIAENGALASMCLYREGRRAFPAPLDALRALTVDELCAVYDACGGEPEDDPARDGEAPQIPGERGPAPQ